VVLREKKRPFFPKKNELGGEEGGGVWNKKPGGGREGLAFGRKNGAKRATTLKKEHIRNRRQTTLGKGKRRLEL